MIYLYITLKNLYKQREFLSNITETRFTGTWKLKNTTDQDELDYLNNNKQNINQGKIPYFKYTYGKITLRIMLETYTIKEFIKKQSQSYQALSLSLFLSDGLYEDQILLFLGITKYSQGQSYINFQNKELKIKNLQSKSVLKLFLVIRYAENS